MKRVLVLLAVVASVLYAGTFTITASALSVPDGSKWFVCKYVGTPGVDERFQTGQNPISIAGGSLPTPIVPGTFFNDSQGRSFILVQDTGQPEPPLTDCPPPDTGGSPSPSTPPSESVPPSESPSPPPSESPSAPPSESIPPSASPSSSPPVITAFAVEPDVCRFEGDSSRIRFRILAGLILFSQIDIYIDGNLIDRNDIIIAAAPIGVELAAVPEAFVVVEPGPHAWTITEEGDPEAVLASGDVVCPTCFNLVSPTPTGGTLPSTDTADSSAPGLPLVLGLVALAVLGLPFVIRRQRVP